MAVKHGILHVGIVIGGLITLIYRGLFTLIIARVLLNYSFWQTLFMNDQVVEDY